MDNTKEKGSQVTMIIDTKDYKGMPTISDGFYFLCTPTKAKKGDFPKPYAGHVMNDGEYWWATDGHRLHGLDLDGFGDPGVYKVVKNTKSQVILQKTEKTDFPDINAVWPAHNDYTEIDCYSSQGTSVAYTKIVRQLESAQTLNYEYINDVLCDDFQAFIYGTDKPVAFLNTNKLALVMPMMI